MPIWLHVIYIQSVVYCLTIIHSTVITLNVFAPPIYSISCFTNTVLLIVFQCQLLCVVCCCWETARQVKVPILTDTQRRSPALASTSALASLASHYSTLLRLRPCAIHSIRFRQLSEFVVTCSKSRSVWNGKRFAKVLIIWRKSYFFFGDKRKYIRENIREKWRLTIIDVLNTIYLMEGVEEYLFCTQ